MPPIPTVSALISRSFTAVTSGLAWPVRVVRHRALLHQMAAMSDCELRDVGLTRHDLRDAVALPPGADPSLLFRSRVDERRLPRPAFAAGKTLPSARSRPVSVPPIRRAFPRVVETVWPSQRPV